MLKWGQFLFAFFYPSFFFLFEGFIFHSLINKICSASGPFDQPTPIDCIVDHLVSGTCSVGSRAVLRTIAEPRKTFCS